MADYTPRLGLIKPTPDEMVDIQAQINANSDMLDVQAGAFVCTSTTRPSAPYPGQIIYETDTNLFLIWRISQIWGPLGDQLYSRSIDYGNNNVLTTFNPTSNGDARVVHKVKLPTPKNLDTIFELSYYSAFTAEVNSEWSIKIGFDEDEAAYATNSLPLSSIAEDAVKSNSGTSSNTNRFYVAGKRTVFQTDPKAFVGVKIFCTRLTGAGPITFVDKYGSMLSATVTIVGANRGPV